MAEAETICKAVVEWLSSTGLIGIQKQIRKSIPHFPRHIPAMAHSPHQHEALRPYGFPVGVQTD